MKDYQLCVSELSWNTTERKLETIFSIIGEVKNVTLIRNSISGESLGKAFISMGKESDVKTAVQVLDRKEVNGRRIRVSMMSLSDKSFTKAILLNA